MSKGIWALALGLVPRVVAACPACAGRNDATSLKTVAVLALMMGIPFVVAGVVLRIVRRVEGPSP